MNYKSFLQLVAGKRLKFYYYRIGFRPVSCSGYLVSIISPFVYVRHLKLGKKYSKLDRLLLTNIRFLSSCFNMNTLKELETLKINIEEDRKLTKFDVIS